MAEFGMNAARASHRQGGIPLVVQPPPMVPQHGVNVCDARNPVRDGGTRAGLCLDVNPGWTPLSHELGDAPLSYLVVLVTFAGRKPRAIIQTASTSSCTASGMDNAVCAEELASNTPYIASRPAAK